MSLAYAMIISFDCIVIKQERQFSFLKKKVNLFRLTPKSPAASKFWYEDDKQNFGWSLKNVFLTGNVRIQSKQSTATNVYIYVAQIPSFWTACQKAQNEAPRQNSFFVP